MYSWQALALIWSLTKYSCLIVCHFLELNHWFSEPFFCIVLDNSRSITQVKVSNLQFDISPCRTYVPFLGVPYVKLGPSEITRWPIYSAGSRALIYRTHRNTAVRDFFLHVLVAALKGRGLDYLQWFRPADLTCQDCLMHVNYVCQTCSQFAGGIECNHKQEFITEIFSHGNTYPMQNNDKRSHTPLFAQQLFPLLTSKVNMLMKRMFSHLAD